MIALTTRNRITLLITACLSVEFAAASIARAEELIPGAAWGALTENRLAVGATTQLINSTEIVNGLSATAVTWSAPTTVTGSVTVAADGAPSIASGLAPTISRLAGTTSLTTDAAPLLAEGAGAAVLLRSAAGYVPYVGGALALGAAVYMLKAAYDDMDVLHHSLGSTAVPVVFDTSMGFYGGVGLIHGQVLSLSALTQSDQQTSPGVTNPNLVWNQGHAGCPDNVGYAGWLCSEEQGYINGSRGYPTSVAHNDGPNGVSSATIDSTGVLRGPVDGGGQFYGATNGEPASYTYVGLTGDHWTLYSGVGKASVNTVSVMGGLQSASQTKSFTPVRLKDWPKRLTDGLQGFAPPVSPSNPMPPVMHNVLNPFGGSPVHPIPIGQLDSSKPTQREQPDGTFKRFAPGAPFADPGVVPANDPTLPAYPTDGTGSLVGPSGVIQAQSTAAPTTAPTAAPTTYPTTYPTTAPDGHPTSAPTSVPVTSPPPSLDHGRVNFVSHGLVLLGGVLPFDWFGDAANSVAGTDTHLHYTTWAGEAPVNGTDIEQDWDLDWLKPGFRAVEVVAVIGLIAGAFLWL